MTRTPVRDVPVACPVLSRNVNTFVLLLESRCSASHAVSGRSSSQSDLKLARSPPRGRLTWLSTRVSLVPRDRAQYGDGMLTSLIF